MSVDQAYQVLYSAAAMILGVLMTVMLVRSARGPGVPDRLLSINMLGTLVIAFILLLSVLMRELFLVDVALLYTMISLIAVLILARVYIPDNDARGLFMDREEEESHE